MSLLWQRVIENLDAAGVVYCRLRGGEMAVEAGRAGPRTPDVDLLVAPAHLGRMEVVLHHLGFVRLPAWGFAPHRWFVGYDEATDRWLKLDVVDRIAFGRPVHAIDTQLAPRLLEHRRRIDGVDVPAVEHELLALVLHAILDKRAFSPSHQSRLAELCLQADPATMQTLLTEHDLGARPWSDWHEDILNGRWEDLLALGRPLKRRLIRHGRLGYCWRVCRDRVLRKMHKALRMVRSPAPAVALLAPDGGGKSTLAAGLCESFFLPVRRIYMGLPPSRRRRARRLPGWGLLSMIFRQWGRYAASRFHRGRGRLVVFDRYTYDALLPGSQPLGAWRRLRRWLLAHACPAPDLVVVLDAPGELLYERKGEHTAAHLEAQRLAYRDLEQRLAHTVVIDGTTGAHRVRSAATRAIWRRYRDLELARGGRAR